jgi:hypothetical protein
VSFFFSDINKDFCQILDGGLFPFLVIIEVLFVLQNEIKSTKNNVVRPYGEKKYITLKIK